MSLKSAYADPALVLLTLSKSPYFLRSVVEGPRFGRLLLDNRYNYPQAKMPCQGNISPLNAKFATLKEKVTLQVNR